MVSQWNLCTAHDKQECLFYQFSKQFLYFYWKKPCFWNIKFLHVNKILNCSFLMIIITLHELSRYTITLPVLSFLRPEELQKHSHLKIRKIAEPTCRIKLSIKIKIYLRKVSWSCWMVQAKSNAQKDWGRITSIPFLISTGGFVKIGAALPKKG